MKRLILASTLMVIVAACTDTGERPAWNNIDIIRENT